MVRRVLPAVVVTAAVLLVSGGAGAQTSAVTIGAPDFPTGTTTKDAGVLGLANTSAAPVSYLVPEGAWRITSWSLTVCFCQGAGELAALIVVEPMGSGGYVVRETSGSMSIPASSDPTTMTNVQ